MPVNQTGIATQQTQRRRAGRPSSTQTQTGGISNFFGSVLMPLGRQICAEAAHYNLPNAIQNKLKSTFGEVARELVGPEAFTGSAVGMTAAMPVSIGAVPQTTRRVGRARKSSTRATGGPLTAAQQTVLNSINPNEQITAPIVAARIGQPIRSCLNSLNGLQNRGYLQKGAGRGANAVFWKVQQAASVAA
jgi:hypothetical protein